MEKRNGMLYPMMVIAAISVILFSIVGIATMTGHIPGALSQKDDAAVQAAAEKDALAEKEAAAAKEATATKEAQGAKEAQAAKEEAVKQAEADKLAAAKEAEAARQIRASRIAAARPAVPRAERSTSPAPREAEPVVQKTAVVCTDCGVVESVQAEELKGKGSGLGAVGGAVLGGLLGHQVGSGRGKDLATIAGAVGGGFGGNEVEKNVKKTVNYVIRVRMEDGTYRSITQSTQPGVAAGDHVRIENGAVVAQG